MAKKDTPTTGTAVTTTAPAKEKLTFQGLLDRAKPQIAAVLPKHLTAERMVALANLAASRTPKLKECAPLSLFNAVMTASRLGLEIGQHAHLVPFKNGRTQQTECVLIPDYRGLIHLAVSTGKVVHISASVVYRDDYFDFQLGDKPTIAHKPKLDGQRTLQDIVAFYAVAHLPGGLVVFDEPMTLAEVNAVRKRSRAGDEGPWVSDFVAMGKKTVVKRLCKFLPQTPELAAAIEVDTRAETGEMSTVSAIIDTNESVAASVAETAKQQVEDLKAKMAEKKAESEPEPPTQDDGTKPVPPEDEGDGKLPF